MVEKTIKTKTLGNPEKPAKEIAKPKVKKMAKPAVVETPKKAEKAAKKVLPEKKIAKPEVVETPKKTEKAGKKVLPVKAMPVVTEPESKKKRISKGLATHNRRVKQEKRHPAPVKK